MTVSILGCGWYGRAVASKLLSQNIVVKGSATNPEKAEQLRLAGIKPFVIRFDENSQVFDADFFKCDVLIIALPPGIRKNQGHLYLPRLKRVAGLLRDHKIDKVIYVSSTGVYADCNRELDESDIPEPDSESGRILYEAEKIFSDNSLFRSTIIRFGGMVGPGRDPGGFFRGKTDIPNGLAPVNLIHQADCAGITCAIINNDCFSTVFNACSPDHPPKQYFYREMAKISNSPLPVFKNELNNWKIVNSVNLVQKLNYEFTVKSWADYPRNNLSNQSS